MTRLATMVRELSVPHWPTVLACATSAPCERTPAAHTAAGQRAALFALSRAGCDVAELPPRSGRRPVWPTGFVGSIAHDDALAVAVAARADVARTVGIDVERHDALSAADAYVVFHDDEIDLVGDDSALATRLWGAKEAAYKAWCTGLDVELDHVDPRDIRVTALDSVALIVHAVGDLTERVAPIGALRGGWLRHGDLAITLVWKLEPLAT